MAELHVHTLVVRDHRISCCDTEMVQHGMGHDAIQLDLDAEWDGLSLRVVLGSGDEAAERLWDGEPWVVPASLLAEPDWLPVSVVGYDGDGTVRVVTERCDRLLKVVASGQVDGSEPIPDAPDLLGQLVEAADKATDAAGEADRAAESASAAASAATSAADAATKAADRADSSADAADKAAESANQAAAAAGEKVLYAYPDPEASDRIILQYPSFLESEDGGSVYLALEAANG